MNSNDIGIADSRNRLREKAQNEATCFALNDMLKDAQEEVRRLREQWQYYQDFCKQNGFNGITAMAVAVDKLREENERLRKDAERGQFLVERGEWFRHNHDTPHAYALLAIRLPYTADLSCKAMREDAIDAARGAK